MGCSSKYVVEQKPKETTTALNGKCLGKRHMFAVVPCPFGSPTCTLHFLIYIVSKYSGQEWGHSFGTSECFLNMFVHMDFDHSLIMPRMTLAINHGAVFGCQSNGDAQTAECCRVVILIIEFQIPSLVISCGLSMAKYMVCPGGDDDANMGNHDSTNWWLRG